MFIVIVLLLSTVALTASVVIDNFQRTASNQRAEMMQDLGWDYAYAQSGNDSSTIEFVNILVTSADDSYPSFDYCFPNSTLECNLRSAWSVCTNLLPIIDISIVCNILFAPEITNMVMYSDYNQNTFAELVYSPSHVSGDSFPITQSIAIIGNDGSSPVVIQGDGASDQRFIDISSSSAFAGTFSLQLINMQVSNFGTLTTRRLDLSSSFYSSGSSGSVLGSSSSFPYNPYGGGSGDDYFYYYGYVVPTGVGCNGTVTLNAGESSSNVHLLVRHSSFSENEGIEQCGAIATTGLQSVTIQNSTFTSNVAYVVGGALSFANTYNIKVENSTFTSNSAINHGGAIAMDQCSNITIIDSYFSNNQAIQSGGAIVLHASTFFNLTNSVFDGSAATADSAGKGGAVYIDSSSNASVKYNSFAGLTATIEGGAICFSHSRYIDISWNTFVGSQATEGGGHIYLDYSNHVLIEDNQMAAVNIRSSDQGSGGGIYLSRCTDFIVRNTEFTGYSVSLYGGALRVLYSAQGLIENIRFVNNTAHPGASNGGGGGALGALSINNITIINCTFIGNQVTSNGGGGAVSIIIGSDVLFLDCTFSDNLVASAGYGGGGGAMEIYSFENLTFDNCTFTNNLASAGGALFIATTNKIQIKRSHFISNIAMWTGGAINILSGCTDYEFYLTIFKNNSAVSGNTGTVPQSGYRPGGGALWINDVVTNMIFSDCSFINNFMQVGVAGAIGFASYNQQLSFDGCLFENNSALNGAGGGIFFGYTVTATNITNSTFTGNKAGLSGGGAIAMLSDNIIYLRDVAFIANGIVNNPMNVNLPSPVGGALLITDSNTITIISCQFTHNFAQKGGGIAFNLSNTIDIESSRFDGNFATQGEGGAMRFDAGNTVTIVESVFDGNLALNDITGGNGGAAMFISFSCRVIVQQSIFTNNQALQGGGGAIMIFSNSFLLVTRSTFTANVVDVKDSASYGGAIYSQASNQLTIEHSTFDSNSASSDSNAGGALAIGSTHTMVNVFNVSFTGNSAGNGGAVYVGSLSSVSIGGCLFDSNSASSVGGGGVILELSTACVISHCTFTKNEAITGVGGGLYLTGDNSTSIDTCDFLSNTAQEGSAIYAVTANTSYIITPPKVTNSLFAYNEALFGGTFFWFADNSLWSGPLDILAGFAGNISSLVNNTGSTHLIEVVDVNCSFTVEYPLYEGQVQGTTPFSSANCYLPTLIGPVTIGGECQQSSSTFINLYLETVSADSSSDLLAYGYNQKVCNNKGAYEYHQLSYGKQAIINTNLAYYPQQNISLLQQCVYGNGINTGITPISGFQFVYSRPTDGSWVPGENMWIDASNIAPYGARWATQLFDIDSTTFQSSELILESYTTSFPFANFYLYDFYGQLMKGPNQALIGVSTSLVNITDSCAPRVPPEGYVNGIILNATRNGVGSLTSAQLLCYPGKTMKIAVGTVSVFDTSPAIVKQLNVTFRACIPGEILSTFACAACPYGFYSLQLDADDWTKTTCISCPSHAECGNNTINVSKGYWRNAYLSSTPQKCPLGRTACLGGTLPLVASDAATASTSRNVSTDIQCYAGYTGPLCNVCATGYYYSSGSLTCNICSNSGAGQLALLVIVPVLIWSVVAWAVLNAKSLTGTILYATSDIAIKGTVQSVVSGVNKIASTATSSSANTAMATAAITEARTWKESMISILGRLKGFMPAAKIMMSVFQIVSGFPMVLQISFPFAISGLFGVMGKINFASLNVGSPQCYSTNRFDYIDSMMMTTLAPIVISVLIFVGYRVNQRKLQKKLDEVILTGLLSGKGNESGSQQDDDANNRIKSSETMLAPAPSPSMMAMTTNPMMPSIVTTAHDENKPNVVMSREDELKAKLSVLRSRYMNLFFLLTYLVLPSVSVNIFGAFPCTNTDPDNVDSSSEGSLYMTNDMSINCSSSRYYYGVGWAVIMIFVYPVGVLVMYLYLLYINRYAIRHRLDETHAGTSSAASAEIVAGSAKSDKEPFVSHKEISFLYESYKPRLWYWEVIETIRRLLLTAVLSVLGAGSPPQIIAGILIALAFTKLYGLFTPFIRIEFAVLQELAQYQILLTLLAAFILLTGSFAPYTWGDSSVDFGLILINISTSALVIHFALLQVSSTYVIFLTNVSLLFQPKERARAAQQKDEMRKSALSMRENSTNGIELSDVSSSSLMHNNSSSPMKKRIAERKADSDDEDQDSNDDRKDAVARGGGGWKSRS